MEPAISNVNKTRGVAWWAYLLVALVAIGVYANSLANSFALDDVAIVQENQHVTDLHWAEIWGDNYWPKQDGVAPDVLYRPLTIWTYLVNEWIKPGGAGGVWQFHLANILLQGLAAVLVTALTWRIFGRAWVATVTGLLFAVHPIHTEAVANVVGRAELLAGVWSLLTLLVYLPERPLVGAVPKNELRTPWYRGLLTAVCFFAAMLCKETPVTLLFAMVGIDLWRWFSQGRAVGVTRVGFFRWMGGQAVLCYAPMWAMFGFYMWMRVQACGLMADTIHTHPIVNPLVAATLWERFLTPFALLAKYLELTAWPSVLAADYSAPSLMPISRIMDPQVLTGLLAVAGGIFLAVKSWRRRPELTLVVGLFVCSYGLVANVLRIGTIFGERLFYWPSVFVLMLVAYAGCEIAGAMGWVGWGRIGRAAWTAAAGLACVLMSWRTVIRNTDWQDNIALSIASARDNLGSAKACYWAGITLVNAAPQPWMEEFGEKLLERAGELYPEYGESYWELAKYWGRKQEFVKSVELLAKASEYRPGCGYMRMGVDAVRVEMASKDATTFVPQMEAYAKEHPAEASGEYALAIAYESQKRYEEAEKACNAAFSLNHNFHEAAYEMALIRHARGEDVEAVAILRQYVMNVRYNADVRCVLAEYLMSLDPEKFPTALGEAGMNLDKAQGMSSGARIRELREELKRKQGEVKAARVAAG